MQGSLRKRLVNGFSAQAFGQIVNTMIQIISVPLFLYFWGKDLYGEWLIIFAMPAYLMMSDIGFSSVAGNEMTMLTTRGRRREALEVFQSVWVLISSISIVLLIAVLFVLVILTPGRYLEEWFHLSLLSSFEASLILVTLSMYILLVLQGELFLAGFRCEGNFALGIFCYHLVRVIEWGLAFVATGLGATPVVVASTLLIGRAIGVCLQRIALRRRSPWIVYGFSKVKFSRVKRLAVPAVAYMGFPLGEAVTFQGIVLTIGVVLGPVAVVIFSAYRTVTRVAAQLNTVINHTVWPELSSAYGASHLKLARSLYHRAANASLWISLAVVSMLSISGNWIISVWTNNAVTTSSLLLYLMLGVTLTDALWQTSKVVLVSANRHMRIAALYLAVAVGAVPISYVLMHGIGLEGVALSLLAVNLVIVPYATKSALALLHDKFSLYILSMVLPPLLTLRGSKRS